MKVLLVLPAADHVRVTQNKKKVPKRKMLRFSILPLTTVAALTPQKHQVEICDENVQPLDFNTEADVIGITFMTALANRAYEIADAFRAKGKTVIAGGYHPTLYPQDAASHFNALVIGDAEDTWPQLLDDIEKGKLKKIYHSAMTDYKDNKEAFNSATPHCGSGTSAQDLAETPIPRRDLMSRTARHYATTNAVQTGRGCAHGCRYCSITAFYKKTYRHRTVQNVIEELNQISRNFIFVDDNIIADREYAKELFRAMIPLKKRWVSQCSIEIADDPELLKLAKKAGCQGLFIGIESISESNLNAIGKAFNAPDRYRERIRTIRRSGIGVIAGIIVGMDKDDITVFQKTLQFLQGMRIDSLQLNIMTPLPGTPLYDDLEKAKRIIDRDWSHYDFRHVVIKPAWMTKQQLQDGADWLIRQYYRMDRVILRTLRTLFTVGLLPAYLGWRLNMTYRHDVKKYSIIGRNPVHVRMGKLPMKKKSRRILHLLRHITAL
jgi:radical SAM superfamily enzyme YgiQ (UPF0313 family)